MTSRFLAVVQRGEDGAIDEIRGNQKKNVSLHYYCKAVFIKEFF